MSDSSKITSRCRSMASHAQARESRDGCAFRWCFNPSVPCDASRDASYSSSSVHDDSFAFFRCINGVDGDAPQSLSPKSSKSSSSFPFVLSPLLRLFLYLPLPLPDGVPAVSSPMSDRCPPLTAAATAARRSVSSLRPVVPHTSSLSLALTPILPTCFPRLCVCVCV